MSLKSVYMSVYLPVRMFVYLLWILYVCLSIYLRTWNSFSYIMYLHPSVPAFLYACLSVSLQLGTPICLSVFLYTSVCLFLCLHFFFCVRLSVCMYVCVCVRLPACLSVCIFYTSVCPSVCLYLCSAQCVRMYVYLSAFSCACLSVCMSSFVYAWIPICLHSCTPACLFICLDLFTPVCLYVCVCVRMSFCLYLCTPVYLCLHLRTPVCLSVCITGIILSYNCLNSSPSLLRIKIFSFLVLLEVSTFFFHFFFLLSIFFPYLDFRPRHHHMFHFSYSLLRNDKEWKYGSEENYSSFWRMGLVTEWSVMLLSRELAVNDADPDLLADLPLSPLLIFDADGGGNA